jgi:glycosyltransferase involved in cell wall biosynthesis
MAYECSPYRGSEWAVGWGRLLQAAREVEPHVITSESNFGALQRAQSEGLLPGGVRFYTPPPDAKLRKLERKPALFAYNYTAYHHWQKLAFQFARELHARERFDLVHQVNVATFREPGYTWKLGIPFLWGPVGGTQNFPVRFLTMLSPVEAFKEAMRGISNLLSLRCKRRVRAAARTAAMVVAANSANKRDYERVFGREVELLLETGLHQVDEPDRTRFQARVDSSSTAPLQILWSGELQSRKALPVLLRALATLRDVPCVLKVLGDGPMRARWSAEAQSLGIASQVHFLGRLPFAEAVAQMQSADLFCFTSLRDTSGNVVLEALAAGVPVICFDHQGAGDMLDATCGIKISVTSPRQSIADWANAIRDLATDAPKLLRLSEATTARAKSFLWQKNGDWMLAAYRRVVASASSPIEITTSVAP